MGRLPCNCSVLLLLLCLLPGSSMAKDIWAIDCGGNETFTSTTNITWEADDGYAHGGVSRTANNISAGAFSTLRAFEAKKPSRGCYTIPVGIGRKVLVRAEFYYGNYDGMEEPPTFRLQFEASPWDIIETNMDEIVSEEVIYVTKANATSICVARGSTGHTPFISALRIAVLAEGTYAAANSSQALFLVSRVAFGANDTIVDKYFRFWSATTGSLNISDYTILTNSNTSLNGRNLPDDVPAEVLQTAITPVSSSANITIKTPYLQSDPKPIYYNMYFTEPVNLGGISGSDRSFHIFQDGVLGIFGDSSTVIPRYGYVVEYRSSVHMGSNATVFDLVRAANSILPPVISAWELFLMEDVLSDGTDSRDVNGLATLKQQFQVIQDWAGDPCLPTKYKWEWVVCNSDPSPRVTSLDLRGYGLSGKLPDFSSLDALESIDMSNNSLTGYIPSFLGELPNLRTLNLADNDFSTVPLSLAHNNNIRLDVSGNPKLSSRNNADSPAPTAKPQPADDRNASSRKNGLGFIMNILYVCVMYAGMQIA